MFVIAVTTGAISFHLMTTSLSHTKQEVPYFNDCPGNRWMMPANGSLIPRPSHHPVFDRLQSAKVIKEMAWEQGRFQ